MTDLKYMKPSCRVAYHYSTLRTIEDIFGLSHLGDAAMPQVKSFGRTSSPTADGSSPPAAPATYHGCGAR
jgi:hypothetical protein